MLMTLKTFKFECGELGRVVSRLMPNLPLFVALFELIRSGQSIVPRNFPSLGRMVPACTS